MSVKRKTSLRQTAVKRLGANDARARSGCVIVGVGASAGGLEAVGHLLAALPENARALAFVIIQHLDPTHPSLMVELLQRRTPIKVVEAADRMKIQANRIFMIPPGGALTLEGNILRLKKAQEPRGIRTPIDQFLTSLAESQKDRAIGIILSGTGTDGTAGICAIKSHGGMVMVQDPAEAAQDGMPRSAIGTGLVDFVLSLEEMPKTLMRYAGHPYVHPPVDDPGEKNAASGDLQAVIGLLRTKAHFDFSQYRAGTLQRRIHRRMGLRQIKRLPDYLDILRIDANELEQLSKDILIQVTSFFRDPQAYAMLAEKVSPCLKVGDISKPLRVWAPACATGEEAYSIAMLLMEGIARRCPGRMLQIFATDVEEAGLAQARAGVYPHSVMHNVSPERQKRFFTKLDDFQFQVKKELRDAITFARQNVLADPPFSKLDLISCRNLLIYLNSEAQRNVIHCFHFALNPDGLLILGTAESVGPEEKDFEAVSKRWRIFKRIGSTRHPRLEEKKIEIIERRGAALPPVSVPVRLPVIDLVYRQLMQDPNAPAAVLINGKHETVHLFGPVGKFLEITSGEPTRNLFEMTKIGLRARLRNALERATKEKRIVALEGAYFESPGAQVNASIVIQPLTFPANEGLLLIIFNSGELGKGPAGEILPGPDDGAFVRQLEEELKSARGDLHTSIQELEAANEKLKASNEEAVSVNEELQSINEEIETSKEELQSLNEELSTVNAQLHGKIDELENANNDLNNLLSSTEQVTIALDLEFRIKWFTPASVRHIRLQASDRGRLLTDLALHSLGRDLVRDARRALKKNGIVESEIQSDPDRWFLRSAMPYRTKNQQIDGVVITIVEITDRKKAEQALLEYSPKMASRVAHRTAELEDANTQLRNRMGEQEQFFEAIVAKLAESERLRIGMELHDNLSQQLAASGILAAALTKRLDQAKSPVAGIARKVSAAIGEASTTTGKLTKGILPVQIEASALRSALGALASRSQELLGVRCVFECDAPISAPDGNIATHLFYIAQEAVHNAAKHAKAHRISISLRSGERITLTIRDDGQGLKGILKPYPGSGLHIMRYRARIIGAELKIESGHRKGTVVQCVMAGEKIK